jgi:hypothetical protein
MRTVAPYVEKLERLNIATKSTGGESIQNIKIKVGMRTRSHPVIEVLITPYPRPSRIIGVVLLAATPDMNTATNIKTRIRNRPDGIDPRKRRHLGIVHF